MNPDMEELIKSIIEFGKDAYNKKLIWGNSGNISHRIDNDKFIISGSGAHLEKLSESDFVMIHLQDDKVEGKAKPSIETIMHTEIYWARKDVKVVFHSQPVFTTYISCTNIEVDTKLFPESMAYIDKIQRVPYHHPGSQELAKDVSDKVKHCDVLILSNHGAICTDKSLEGVLLKTQSLELLCRMIVLSRISETALNYLPQNIKDEFLQHLKEMK